MVDSESTSVGVEEEQFRQSYYSLSGDSFLSTRDWVMTHSIWLIIINNLSTIKAESIKETRISFLNL